MPNMMDFIIEGSMGFYMVAVVSPQAREWVDANVNLEDYQDPYCFACEGRYVEQITYGMLEEGFLVEVNGRRAFIKDGEILSMERNIAP